MLLIVSGGREVRSIGREGIGEIGEDKWSMELRSILLYGFGIIVRYRLVLYDIDLHIYVCGSNMCAGTNTK